MEIKEAIKRLQDHFRVHDDGKPTPKLDEACKIAYECMEKQLPKKLVDKRIVGRCPCCNEIIVEGTKICDCGQKIDWTEAH